MAKNAFGAGTVAALVISLAVGGLGGYMFGVRAGEKSAKFDEAPVAVVNGANITRQDLLSRVSERSAIQTALNQMIDEKLVDLAAAKANITVTEADIDAEIKRLEEQVGGADQLRMIMSQYSYTMPDLRAEQRMRLQLRQILGPQIQVTDAELEQFFLENVDRYDKREVHTRHILVETEEEALAIRAQLVAGADFETLAREHSTDPGVTENGGDYGFTPRGYMVPEYEAAAFNMAVNEISAPVQTQYGYHVIQVLGVRGDVPTFEANKEEVRRLYVDDQIYERQGPWLDEQRTQAKITNTLKP